MAASISTPLSSPALSFTSYGLVSNRSRSVSMASQSLRLNSDDSDDEIVWNISGDSTSSVGSSVDESDFVLLSHPVSAARSVTGESLPDDESREPITPVASQSLEERMASLNIADRSSSSKRVGKRAKKASAKPAAPGSGTISSPKSKKKSKAKKNATPSPGVPAVTPSAKGNVSQDKKSLVKFTGLGARPIVDDISDQLSIVSYDNESMLSLDSPTLYEEASSFISSFLSNPSAQNSSIYRLTLMQSIIIELGLASAALPSTLRAAKAFLKSHAFLNIREYVAVREQGPEAVQRALYPSKNALIKDIRKKPTPIKWVKKHGLQVLLVGWVQH